MSTIYDVAKEAGVSPKTVSRVLNADAPVKEKTRVAVEAAMARLAYVPSNAARTMRSRKSGLVGLITGAISTSPGSGEFAGLPAIHIIQAAQRVLSEQGMTVLISDVGERHGQMARLVQTLLEHRVEGLMYVVEFHERIKLPENLDSQSVVLVNCFDDAGTPAVLPDDEGGEYNLVRGLVERGHSRIAFLTPPEQQVARALRLKGYQRALSEAGLAYDPAMVMTAALTGLAHEFDLLWDVLDRVLGNPDPPTVICCGNDKMAMRVYGLLSDRGLKIPEDISVVGYDDYRIISEQLHPPLTSASLPYEAMGARAAHMLLSMIRKEIQPKETRVDLVSGPVTWRKSVRTYDQTVVNIQSTRRNYK
ncbi:MAG: LacI family DNA-binding transcriptional regulator [Alphaproteobacteria bacterium]|nr:LacI family DNA-binding transcriptional regulator [Alphaproteobacteria bacterium]